MTKSGKHFDLLVCWTVAYCGEIPRNGASFEILSNTTPSESATRSVTKTDAHPTLAEKSLSTRFFASFRELEYRSFLGHGCVRASPDDDLRTSFHAMA